MDDAPAAKGERRPDWTAIRSEYESRQFLPAMICKRHGITPAQLRYRREQEDWPLLRARRPRRTELVTQMLRVLAAQIQELEKATDMPIEKRAKLLAEHARTMDRLIERGAAKRNVEPPTRKDMTDLRAKLVKRLDQFKAR
ncbi:hypothetical protein [Devosia sediminis]|uniref:Uncharacterized protein n=1 Tax=Devosia sediminis TaxID=2798801 RepID=A0A934IVL5_9HYPH|nr:hypothetical protein [Devosia sediminis]MBJ3785167.1 hypothetical protein [Devosia sediminis]